MTKHRGQSVLLGAIAIILLALGAYIPALRAGFIWQDSVHLTHNPLITAPGGLARIWYSTDSPSQYYPLVYTMFRLEHALWGMNPIGYHAVNLLLHIANALLLWWLLRRLRLPGAWLAAVIWALHPVNAEPVVWIAERKAILSTFFGLCALLTSLRFMDNSDRGWWKSYLPGFVFYALALFANAFACMLPVAMLIIHWFREKHVGRRQIMRAAPLLIWGIAVGLMAVWWVRNLHGADDGELNYSVADRCLVAGRAIWFYLAKLVCPTPLMFDYPKWSIHGHDPVEYFWPALSLAAAIVIWRYRAKARGLFAAAAFFTAIILPVLGFINLYAFEFSFVADRYLYMASMGPIVLIVAFLSKEWSNRWMRLAVGGILPALIIASFAGLAWRQACIFHDPETLWRVTIVKNPRSWVSHKYLANLLADRGDVAEAVYHYEEALRFNPHSAEAHLRYGMVLMYSLGRVDEAIPHFEKLVISIREVPEPHYQLGVAYVKKGRLREAVGQFRTALWLRPSYVEARRGIASALADLGYTKSAIKHYRILLKTAPADGPAHRSLAVLLFRAGRYAESQDEASQAEHYGAPCPAQVLDALAKKGS